MRISSLERTKEAFVCLLLVTLFISGTLGMVSGTVQARAMPEVDPPIFNIEPFYDHNTHQDPRPYFVYNTNPFTQINDSVQVENIGKVRGTVKLYPVDAFTNEASGMAFRTRNDPRLDVGSWISMASEQLTLNPGQSTYVSFQVNIPSTVRPGQHFGGIVAEPLYQETVKSTQPDKTSFGVHILSFIILGVQVNIAGNQTEQLQASDIHYDSQSQYQRILLGLANTGTQMLHPTGTIQIFNQNGKQLQNIPLKLKAFLPQTNIHYPIYMKHPALDLGQTYQARVHLTYESNHVLDYVTTFAIPLPPKIFSIPVPPAISSLVVAPNAENIFSHWTLTTFIIVAIIIFFGITTFLFWGRRFLLFVNRLRQKLASRSQARHGSSPDKDKMLDEQQEEADNLKL